MKRIANGIKTGARADEAIRYAEVRAEYAGRYSKSDSARVNLRTIAEVRKSRYACGATR